MNYFFYILLFLSVNYFAQQTTQFTQFTFNKYGYNPAAAGSNINGKVEAIVGIRKQWIGFDRAPASNFFSVNYTFKPERSYKRWHNAGIYAINDSYGIFQNFGIYGSYTLHLPLTKRLNMSMGIFAGARRFSVIKTHIDAADPVNIASSVSLWTYPDIIPGFRLHSKKMFFDISLQQLYKNTQSQGNKQIGNKSFLTHQLYVSYGRRVFLDNGFVLIPALNIHSSFTNIPSAEFNFMAYYNKRIGIGASVRGRNFISGIVQLRIIKNVTMGIAYDYSLSRISATAPHSLEFMVGVTPMMLIEGDKMRNSIAKCPTFDF